MLQQDQEQEISRLEEELEEQRFQHEDRIRSMKTKFLKEKKAFEEATEARIMAMADSANKVGYSCGRGRKTLTRLVLKVSTLSKLMLFVVVGAVFGCGYTMSRILVVNSCNNPL